MPLPPPFLTYPFILIGLNLLLGVDAVGPVASLHEAPLYPTAYNPAQDQRVGQHEGI